MHKEVLELSERLDESLILGKEEKNEVKVEIPHPNQASSPLRPFSNQNLDSYPSIFDDWKLITYDGIYFWFDIDSLNVLSI